MVAETIYRLVLSLADQSLWSTALLVFVVTLLLLVLKDYWQGRKRSLMPVDDSFKVGDITIEELGKYDGTDPFLPLLFAVRGTVFDVTKGRDFYGPGGGYAQFAGKEVSRALATMSLKVEDCTDKLDDVSEKQLETLRDWESKFKIKYSVAGKIVPPKELSTSELRAFDGSDNSKPIYLSIKGTIFDVTKGREFYGPEGIYPFAGHECARAFALLSTDTKDCNDNLEGLHKMELDMLRDWEEKFYSKYKIVGRIIK